MQELCIYNVIFNRKINLNNNTIQAITYGLNFLKEHKAEINKYFPSADQSIFTYIFNKFDHLTYGLYALPLFTVGIPSEKKIKNICIIHPIHCNKEYALKERLLYYIDNNNYYTSLAKHYIWFSRDILTKNIIYITSVIISLNLTLILPDQFCEMPNCIYEMYPEFGDKSLIQYLEEKRIEFRESTFLRHPLVPKIYKNIYTSSLEYININITNIYKTIYIK